MIVSTAGNTMAATPIDSANSRLCIWVGTAGFAGALSSKLNFFELIQSQPDDVVRHRRVSIYLQQLTQLRDCSLAITILPNASGCEIQAVSLVGREIVNKRFIRQFPKR